MTIGLDLKIAIFSCPPETLEMYAVWKLNIVQLQKQGMGFNQVYASRFEHGLFSGLRNFGSEVFTS